MTAQNALPSLQAEDMLVIFTPGYPLTDTLHHSSRALAPDNPILPRVSLGNWTHSGQTGVRAPTDV